MATADLATQNQISPDPTCQSEPIRSKSLAWGRLLYHVFIALPRMTKEAPSSRDYLQVSRQSQLVTLNLLRCGEHMPAGASRLTGHHPQLPVQQCLHILVFAAPTQ